MPGFIGKKLIEMDFGIDIERLPGCSTKIAELYQEWLKDGETKETAAAASDAKMSTLMLFYDIWGVGDTTAREFYNKGKIVTRYRQFICSNNQMLTL